MKQSRLPSRRHLFSQSTLALLDGLPLALKFPYNILHYLKNIGNFILPKTMNHVAADRRQSY